MRGSGTSWGGPYLINFTSKHKFARLHLIGGCYRRPGFELKDCAYHEDLAGVSYDMKCKDCFRGAPASEASSSSESSSTSISTS